jgi:hypothetical protein
MLRIIRTAKAISRNRQGLSAAWEMAEARKRKIAVGECGAVARAPSSGSDLSSGYNGRGLSICYRTAVTRSRWKGKSVSRRPLKCDLQSPARTRGVTKRCSCAANPGSAPRQIRLRVRWTQSFREPTRVNRRYTATTTKARPQCHPQRVTRRSAIITRAPTSDQTTRSASCSHLRAASRNRPLTADVVASSANRLARAACRR